jgi:hypothetical protein
VSFLGGFDGSDGARAEPNTQGPGLHEERRSTRSGLLAVGTLACSRCDAPVAPSTISMSPGDALTCPFCDHSGAVRDFLSLALPSRPARVEVRVAHRHRLPAAKGRARRE